MQVLSAPTEFQKQQAQGSQVINGLYEVFQDDTLTALIQQTLNHNLNIQLALKQLEEAGFNAGAELGNILPRYSSNLSTSREKDATEQLAGNYALSLDVSWEIDIWGKLRDQKGVLDATVLSNAENYQAVVNSVAAQAMQSWFDVVTAEKQVALERARLNNLRKSAENSRRNYKAGLGPLDDLEAVKRDIAQTKAALAININNCNTALRTMQVLMGQYPRQNPVRDYSLPVLLPPPQAGLPADLVTERPDLRRAWQEVVAADTSVQVAHKSMFPSWSLTGSLGTSSNTFSDWMNGATIWSLANDLAVPLYNAQQLKNRMNAAHSRAEQAWIRYLQTVLTAFREVEEALDREHLLEDQEREQQRAFTYAENTARIFKERYQNGLVSILEYLTAQNTVFDIHSRLLSVRNERLKNRVTLALAIGKGV